MQRKPLKHLSLCSGIGGLDLAAEWAGIRTVAQCEIDGYASRVLEKNFKGVPNLHDIRTVTNERLRERGIAPEKITVISAGFPCQPYSLAGKGRGDRDERDLWEEVKRVIGEIRPRWFVGENTPGLFSRENQRYFRRILSDLAALGYNVGWGIWGACDVGAPHKRERVFLVAHADGERRGVFGAVERTACGSLGKSETKTPLGTGSTCGTARGGYSIRKTFPTPLSSDAIRVRYSEETLRRVGERRVRKEYKKGGLNLTEYVTVFPMSKTSESMTAGNGGKLNPTWVEWLMGFPLGWTDLDASGTR